MGRLVINGGLDDFFKRIKFIDFYARLVLLACSMSLAKTKHNGLKSFD